MSDPVSYSTPELDPELMRLVEPFDAHNRELLANVHPPDWVNPEPAERYHLVVVGGGGAVVARVLVVAVGSRGHAVVPPRGRRSAPAVFEAPRPVAPQVLVRVGARH